MRLRLAVAVLLVAACGSTTVAPSSATPGAPAAGAAVDCDGKTCAAPASCIDVVGRNPAMGRKECWITCSDKQCPGDMHCENIHDGPGLVCEREDASR